MLDASVIIPAFNRWRLLSEAVASVIGQRNLDFELIIVDDGSTDETAARLPALVTELFSAQHPVRILRTDNHGPAAARNRGVDAARAPLVAFLDSDDLWQPGKLHRQVEYMKHNPECQVSQTEEIWMRRGVRVNPGRRHQKRAGNFFLDSLRTCLISPSAVMIRTSTFHDLGGFDEDMRAAEDYDLWLRLQLRHPVDLLPEPLVIRRAGHPGQLSSTMPALDRFRILALLKLLRHSDLDCNQRNAVCDALVEKCRVYSNGANRRGKWRQAAWIAALGRTADNTWRTGANSTLEDAIYALRNNLREHASTSAQLNQDSDVEKTNGESVDRNGESVPIRAGEALNTAQAKPVSRQRNTSD
ncbi:MAG: glycosyltransferase family 2 protein [Deltaproteobacteria bacterium]|nr:glycosyltransferase family 2 protein [Deltaproteobacteria bacterium]